MAKTKKVRRIVKLFFEQRLIKEPITFKMAMKYNVVPNIRRARVTADMSELVLELEGEEKNVEKGIKYLINAGVDVKPIEGDIVD